MKRKTNTQVVNNIMNYSDYGALAQAFVMNALSTAADAVVAGGVEALPEGGAIAPQAWVGVAREIKTKLDEHFKGVAK